MILYLLAFVFFCTISASPSRDHYIKCIDGVNGTIVCSIEKNETSTLKIIEIPGLDIINGDSYSISNVASVEHAR